MTPIPLKISTQPAASPVAPGSTSGNQQLATSNFSQSFQISGMNCASCVSHVEKSAKKVAGVQSAQVNLATGKATVTFDPAQTTAAAIAQSITASGYPAEPLTLNPFAPLTPAPLNPARRSPWRTRAAIALILRLPLELAHWLHLALHHGMAMSEPPPLFWASVAASTIAILYVGAGFYRGAWNALRRGTTNMDTLIAMGATVAFGYSLLALLGHLLNWWPEPKAYYFMESTGLLALISLGHWLESRARASAGSAIAQLMNLAPQTATKLTTEDKPIEIPLADVQIGDRLLIRPGDRVPTDAVILDGTAAIDESMLTGEPIPAARSPGDRVIGGTVNTDGRLVIRAEKIGSETALARIVQLVESAQAAKPPVQRLADQISAIFVPAVLIIAALTGIIWFAIARHHNWPPSQTWPTIANAVCSVLIIACPCALGLALPAALMVSTGLGARRGILIRDLDALQHAEKIDTILFDKTGTLTEGHPTVQSIESPDPTQTLKIAAALAQFSTHPLSKAIVTHAQASIASLPTLTDFRSHPGAGLSAQLGPDPILLGTSEFLRSNKISLPDTNSDGPSVHVARAQRFLGTIHFSDRIKPDAAATIAELKQMNLRPILVTGDIAQSAQSVADAVGISEIRSQVKPADKAAIVKEFQNGNSPPRVVAMVGDGINDAPALAAADLGIALAAGSDIAKESGGIILIGSSLRAIPAAIRLSRQTMRVIRRNLFFAFIYNILAIPLAAAGLLNPLIAAAAMALSDLTVIGSALLLRRADLFGPNPPQAISPSADSAKLSPKNKP
jgi:Cu+-exporting ATPase